MTHEIAGLLPAHLKGKLVQKSTKKAPENGCLTHVLTLDLTHEIAGSLPAHCKAKSVRRSTKKAPENPCLTHDLTHEMTHAFGSSFPHQMSVLTHIAAKFKIEIFVRFDTLVHVAKKVCQIPARTLTLAPCMACSLNPHLFTAKNPTL